MGTRIIAVEALTVVEDPLQGFAFDPDWKVAHTLIPGRRISGHDACNFSRCMLPPTTGSNIECKGSFHAVHGSIPWEISSRRG